MDKVYTTSDRVFAADFASNPDVTTICEAEYKDGKIIIHDIVELPRSKNASPE